MKILTRCANCALVFLGVAFLVHITYLYYKSWDVPLVQISGADVVLTPKIHSGEDLIFHRTIFREKICGTDVDNFILYKNSLEEEVVVYRERMIGGWSRLGKSTAELHIHTPELPPGRYILRTVVSSSCGETGSMADDIFFDVIP